MRAERVACALKRPWVAVVSPRGPRFGWSRILCGARARRGAIPVEGGTRGGVLGFLPIVAHVGVAAEVSEDVYPRDHSGASILNGSASTARQHKM